MRNAKQKPYHLQEKELWACMTETEREEYQAFLTAYPELANEITNCDRRYYRRHINQSDTPNWYQIEGGGNTASLATATRKGGMRTGPDFVDMIEQADCDRAGKEYYRDPLIRQAVEALSERQRQAVECTVLYKIPTSKLARVWACSERNVRKLRERALHNVCEKYAAALKKKPGHTLADREFLEWYDARDAAKTPFAESNKDKPLEYSAAISLVSTDASNLSWFSMHRFSRLF